MVAFTCPNKGQLIIKKLNGFFALFVQLTTLIEFLYI